PRDGYCGVTRGDGRLTGERASESYWVFARRKRGSPLTQMGMVRAQTPSLAYVYALLNYTERPWHELLVVPRAAFFALGDPSIRDFRTGYGQGANYEEQV